MSSMTRIALALLVAFLGTRCSVSNVQTGARTAAPPTSHVLPNGARAVIQEHTSSDVVALQLWVKAGVHANRERAESDLRHQIERFRADGPSEAELARAKAYVLGNLAMDRRTKARHAWYLAFFELVGVGWDYPERYARALESVSAADVTRVARRYLASPTTVVVRPRS
jgi:predicted Zn-dependent peptidase